MSQLLKGLYTTEKPRQKAINLIEHKLGVLSFPAIKAKGKHYLALLSNISMFTRKKFCYHYILKNIQGNSLAVQWLRLSTFNAGGVSSIPAQGTKIQHAKVQSKNKRDYFDKNILQIFSIKPS